MMKDYVFEDYSIEKILQNKDQIFDTYREYGVVLFPRLLRGNGTYNRYLSDLKKIMNKVIARHTQDPAPPDLGDMLVRLCELKAIDGKIVTDLGTQPNKFFSFNQLKYSSWIDSFLEEVFGGEAECVTPQAGDTLHFFPPVKSFQRYNLPPHQDYQYLMQSPKQVTFYIGLSEHKPDVGGLRIWEKSHRLGILKSTKNQFGSFEVFDHSALLEDYVVADHHWSVGDFGIFDSLLVHSSVPNVSRNCGRVVQIFRYSDLNDATAESYDYYSTAYDRRGVRFEEVHENLYVPPAQLQAGE